MKVLSVLKQFEKVMLHCKFESIKFTSVAPGSIPSSGRVFYVYYFVSLLLCFFTLSKNTLFVTNFCNSFCNVRRCSHVIRFRAHHSRPEIEKSALITFYRSVQMCTHTPSAFRGLHPQIIPSPIIILIEINHQITEYVCKNRIVSFNIKIT